MHIILNNIQIKKPKHTCLLFHVMISTAEIIRLLRLSYFVLEPTITSKLARYTNLNRKN
ncbi:hypothetical protein HanIR_Chr14g0718281 [Helianthus annuus]|nr:hypothetical protein HanIR_Chr14g0718281 [Helianthus annuus]